jgi:O-antigen/teichoic acid export membrane protein
LRAPLRRVIGPLYSAAEATALRAANKIPGACVLHPDMASGSAGLSTSASNMPPSTAKRYATYVFWNGLEQLLNTGLTRAILFPIAAYIIGKEAFGVFTTALSVVLILGATPGGGITTGLVRHIAEYPRERHAQFCRTALQLCHWVMIAILGAGLVALGVTAGLTRVPTAVLACILPLMLSLYAENQIPVIVTELRVMRNFRSSAALTAFQYGTASVAGLIGTLVAGAPGLAWGYAIGMATVYGVLRRRRSHWFQQPYDPGMARVIKAVWFHIMVASILIFSGEYLNRIILSAWHSFAVVSDFYAATTTVQLALAPVTMLSILLMNMLAGYTSVGGLSRAAKTQCVLMAVVGIVGLPLAVYLFGPWVLQIMYPEFGTTPAKLLDILVWGVPFTVLMSWARPFVIKFAPVQVNPAINGLAMAGQLVPALLLIPHWGGEGASWASVIGKAVYGLALASVLIWVIHRCPAPITNTSGAEGSHQGIET